MNVSLPAELARFAAVEAASGEYGTASEVVREGLRLLRREIDVGIADAEAGRFSVESAADIPARISRTR